MPPDSCLCSQCVARATKEDVCGRATDVSDDTGETSQHGEREQVRTLQPMLSLAK